MALCRFQAALALNVNTMSFWEASNATFAPGWVATINAWHGSRAAL